MRLIPLAATALLLTGCGAMYEEVPAFGQTDPTYAVQEQPQRYQAQQQLPTDNQAQQGVDPGQDVNVGAVSDQYADTDPSALTDFKSTLDPYGSWGDDATYGTVWQPDPGVVGSDFAPYVTAGHWSYDNDYVWVSDYDWGWAPFHYGRWVYIAGRGWSWIPGRTYAGAWVDWRVGGPGYGYIGWGPMAPSWYWRNGSAYGLGFRGNTPYAFCGTGDLFSPSLHGRILAGPQVGLVATNTHPWTEGRTPAHPTVGPPPTHFGLAPPPVTRTPGIARAEAFSRPSTAIAYGGHAPMYAAGAMHAQQVPYPPRGVLNENANRPVVTAPRFNGVPPQAYRSYPQPYAQPYRSYGPIGGTPHYNVQPYNAPYHYGTAPTYRAPSAPTYHYGGGGFGGGGGYGGGGGFSGGGGGYRAPSSPTYSHSYSHSSGGGHSGGGRGGHR